METAHARAHTGPSFTRAHNRAVPRPSLSHRRHASVVTLHTYIHTVGKYRGSREAARPWLRIARPTRLPPPPDGRLALTAAAVDARLCARPAGRLVRGVREGKTADWRDSLHSWEVQFGRKLCGEAGRAHSPPRGARARAFSARGARPQRRSRRLRWDAVPPLLRRLHSPHQLWHLRSRHSCWRMRACKSFRHGPPARWS